MIKAFWQYSQAAVIGLAMLPGLAQVPAHGEHWVHAPAPPEMRGDSGDWWLDQDSIAYNDEIAFFTLLRSEGGRVPRRMGNLGRRALDCHTGKSWNQGVCSGTCPASPAFPDDWLQGPRFGPDTFVFQTLCRATRSDSDAPVFAVRPLPIRIENQAAIEVRSRLRWHVPFHRSTVAGRAACTMNYQNHKERS
jgi:hypothetical protein